MARHQATKSARVLTSPGTFGPTVSNVGVEATVDHLRTALGEEAWGQGMNPDMPSDDEVLDNPYQYTDYKSQSTHGARGTVFGEPSSG